MSDPSEHFWLSREIARIKATLPDHHSIPFSPAHSTPCFGPPYLPAELQDMIFSLCLTGGATQVLRLSKNIRRFIRPRLYQDAYLRLDSRDLEKKSDGSRVYSIRRGLSPSKMSLIQNITIYIAPPDLDPYSQLEDNISRDLPAIDFTVPPWTSITRRRTFHLQVSQQDLGLHDNVGSLGKVLKGLATFEDVTMTVVQTSPKADQSEHDCRPWSTVFRARDKEMYQKLRWVWEGTLGPAIYHDSPGQEGRLLAFRPREHLAKVAAILDSETTMRNHELMEGCCLY